MEAIQLSMGVAAARRGDVAALRTAAGRRCGGRWRAWRGDPTPRRATSRAASARRRSGSARRRGRAGRQRRRRRARPDRAADLGPEAVGDRRVVGVPGRQELLLGDPDAVEDVEGAVAGGAGCRRGARRRRRAAGSCRRGPSGRRARACRRASGRSRPAWRATSPGNVPGTVAPRLTPGQKRGSKREPKPSATSRPWTRRRPEAQPADAHGAPGVGGAVAGGRWVAAAGRGDRRRPRAARPRSRGRRRGAEDGGRGDDER